MTNAIPDDGDRSGSIFAEINQPDVDGIPLGKKITQEQRKQIKEKLKNFQTAIKDHYPEIGSGKKGDSRAEQGSNESVPHCMIIAHYLGYTNITRSKLTEDDVRECCRRHFKDTKEDKTEEDKTEEDKHGYPSRLPGRPIHLLVDSKGGSLDSAFRIVLFLRQFTHEIRVYVPRRAKSAGTLIAIASDKILMSPFAELGPLDSQIQDPRNPTKNVSALDLYQSVDYVREFGGNTLRIALKTLMETTEKRVSLTQLLETANNFTLGSTTPLLGQVQPLDFGSWGRTLKIGETYAKSLLGRRQDVGIKEAAGRIAQRLVYSYTHHPYPIDLYEADEIGLKPEVMHRKIYEAAMEVLKACDDSRVVGFAGDLLSDEIPIANGSQPDEGRQPKAHGVDVPTVNPADPR